MTKQLSEIKGREYLADNHSEEYEFFKDLYFGEHHKLFPIHEFEHSLNKYNYVCYNLVKFGVDALSNLYGINKTTFDFGSQELNTAFEEKRKQIDFDEKIEVMIRDYRIYGNAYIAVNESINGSTVENIDPSIVYADFNNFNLAMEAKKYTVKYEKKIDEKTEVYLLVDYLPGQIILTAYLEKGEKYIQVKPFDYFPEIVEGVENENDDIITIETGIEYQSIIALHGSQKDTFYGESQLTASVISLQELVNKMGNLAKYAVTNNSVPRIKLSESSAKILKGIIEESGSDNIAVPTKLGEIKNTFQNSFRAVSWAFSSIAAKMGKKLMFFEENGRGNTEYLVNPYKLDDLFKLQEQSEQKLLRELQVSPSLYNSELASGNTGSGIAYKRLMQLSIQEVENMRTKTADQIAKIAQIMMSLDFGQPIKAPILTFAPIVEDDLPAGNNTDKPTSNPFALDNPKEIIEQ